LRDSTVSRQIALQAWSPPMIAVFLRTRSTTMPASGAARP
jgi:hypothetical protein